MGKGGGREAGLCLGKTEGKLGNGDLALACKAQPPSSWASVSSSVLGAEVHVSVSSFQPRGRGVLILAAASVLSPFGLR